MSLNLFILALQLILIYPIVRIIETTRTIKALNDCRRASEKALKWIKELK